MKLSRAITLVTFACSIFALALFVAPRTSCAATWKATVGAQSSDEGIQALAFLPNELWIHAGDSITWTFPTHEIHTVTFLEQNNIPPISSRSDRIAQVPPEGAVPSPQGQRRRPVAPASTAQPA